MILSIPNLHKLQNYTYIFDIERSMGESLVEAPARENKMGETDPRLGVSVSFGRFGNDALAWEKWSYFSQNKYLEEAGNLSTPGSVAKKKAFFEAHYKKVAAQKAMELEQEKAVEQAGRSSEEPVVEGVFENSSGSDEKSVTCEGDVSEEEIGRETCGTLSTNVMIDDEVKDGHHGSNREAKQGASADHLIDKADDRYVTCNGEVSEEVTGRETCGTFSTNVVIVDEVKDDDPGLNGQAKKGACADHLIDEADLGKENEGTILEIKDEVLSGNGVVSGSNAGEEVSLVAAETPRDNLKMETPPENEDRREQPTVTENESYYKSNARDIARKATATERTTDRIAQASTPRNSRPISIDLTKSVPRVSKKKVNESPLPETKNSRVEESKFLTTGDKDIGKRAFKTSQNRCKGSLSRGKCASLKQQAPPTTFEPKISTFPIPRYENRGLKQSPVPDRKITTGGWPFLRSDERAEKRREFLNNLKAKSITREVENAHRSAKSKEENESEIKKLRQTLNFKATPMPSFYRTRGKGHSHPQKEGVVDNKTRHACPASNR